MRRVTPAAGSRCSGPGRVQLGSRDTREEAVTTQVTTTPTQVRPTMAKPGQTVARPTISDVGPQERAFMDELNFH